MPLDTSTLPPIRYTLDSRGSLLIAGLWAMSIFSIMTVSLSFTASQNVLMLKRDLADFRMRMDFASVLSQVAAKIHADPYPHEDSPADPWMGNIQLEMPLAARAEAFLEDEESKLNLNFAPEALLSAFFKRFEEKIEVLKGDRKDYVRQISKMRQEKRFRALEELLLMEDFEKEDFEKLRPFITVYPELPYVNINTAKPLVLEALLNFLSGDTGTKQIFLGRLKEACVDTGGCFFRSADLTPQLFMEKLKLPRTPLMNYLVQEFLSYVTTDSETFHIAIKEQNAGLAEGIFRYREGNAAPFILWWHEE